MISIYEVHDLWVFNANPIPNLNVVGYLKGLLRTGNGHLSGLVYI